MRRLALVTLTIVRGVSIGQAVAVETDPPGVSGPLFGTTPL